MLILFSLACISQSTIIILMSLRLIRGDNILKFAKLSVSMFQNAYNFCVAFFNINKILELRGIVTDIILCINYKFTVFPTYYFLLVYGICTIYFFVIMIRTTWKAFFLRILVIMSDVNHEEYWRLLTVFNAKDLLL